MISPSSLRKTSSSGFTLIELSVSLVLLALIALGSYLVFQQVESQQRVAQAAADTLHVRTAILKWAAGGPITYTAPAQDDTAEPTPSLALRSWNDLAPHLPGQLHILAKNTDGPTLELANPWKGAYVLGHMTASKPYQWGLDITAVPTGVQEELAERLRPNAAQVRSSCGADQRVCAVFDEQ